MKKNTVKRALHHRGTLAMVFAMAGCLLAGCAPVTGIGGQRISSLGRGVKITSERGQDPTQLRVDDRECATWTRATKGQDEPLPAAELRYAACVIARGYQAQIAYARFASSDVRTLEAVVLDMQQCRMNHAIGEPKNFLDRMVPFRESLLAERAVRCFSERGYTMSETPRWIQDDGTELSSSGKR